MELHRVESSPHIRGEERVRNIMLSVLVALFPSFLWGIYVFGSRALVIVALSVFFSVLTEAAIQKVMKRPVTVSNLTATLTGLLLGLNFPVSTPLWVIPLGAFLAVGVMGQFLGKWIKNFVNPVPAAKLILLGLFPAYLKHFTAPFARLSHFAVTLSEDALASAASPSASLESLGSGEEALSPLRLMAGFGPGGIGEVSGTLLLAGLMYLLVRRVVTWHVPTVFAGTVFLLSFLFPQTGGDRFSFAFSFVFSGGVLLGAVFMATNYQTCPVTVWGKVVYAAFCGIFTVIFRYFVGDASGVCLAILVSNLTSVFLDRVLIPRPYGMKKELVLPAPILSAFRSLLSAFNQWKGKLQK